MTVTDNILETAYGTVLLWATGFDAEGNPTYYVRTYNHIVVGKKKYRLQDAMVVTPEGVRHTNTDLRSTTVGSLGEPASPAHAARWRAEVDGLIFDFSRSVKGKRQAHAAAARKARSVVDDATRKIERLEREKAEQQERLMNAVAACVHHSDALAALPT